MATSNPLVLIAVQDIARSASECSRGAAAELSHGRQPVVFRTKCISTGGAKDSLALFRHYVAPGSNDTSHGLRPWLVSDAAPRLNKDAAFAAPFDAVYFMLMPNWDRCASKEGMCPCSCLARLIQQWPELEPQFLQ